MSNDNNSDNTHNNKSQQWLAKARATQREAAVSPDKNPDGPHTRHTPAKGDAARQFLAQANAAASPPAHYARLIFAMDATASRQPTWDRAMRLQSEMFKATAALGGLNVQLCYFRGYNEFSASPWLQAAPDLESKMRLVSCLGGYTQLEKVLSHALRCHGEHPVRALVFVGDAVEEDVDLLCHLAGKLGEIGLPLYIFQEGNDPFAGQAFAQMARLSKGTHLQLKSDSAQVLASLLGAVAAWAAGGRQALSTYVTKQQAAGDGSLLLDQLSHNLLEDFGTKSTR